MDKVPSNIAIENSSDDFETDIMVNSFERNKLKRSHCHLTSEESKDDDKTNNLINCEHALFQGDENQRNQRRRIAFLEAINVKSMFEGSESSENLTITTSGQETLDETESIQRNTNLQAENSHELRHQEGINVPVRSRRDFLSSYRAPFSLPIATTRNIFNPDAPDLDGRLSLLHRNLLLRTQMRDYSSHPNMRHSDGNYQRESNSGNPVLASEVNPDLAATYLTESNNNLARRLLALDMEQWLASGHTCTAGSEETMRPNNADLEAIMHGIKSTPSPFAMENLRQRGLESSLLNQDAFFLRQELASRSEYPLRPSLSSLLLNSTQHPRFQHTDNLPESPLFASKDAIDGWQIGYQAGVNQAHLNMQKFLTENTEVSPSVTTVTDRYRTLGLDNNTDPGNKRNIFTSQSQSYVPSPESTQLTPERRAELPPLPLCQEDPLPHFSKRICVPLARDEDDNWLSEFLCFIRSDLVEVFRASNGDVAHRINSKKVVFGQVGIRCRYCAHLTHGKRACRSSSFPSSVDRIYQSLTMMIRDHFVRCTELPDALKARFIKLKSYTTQGAIDSKRYWIESAQRLGMVDTIPNQGIMVTEATIVAVQDWEQSTTRTSLPESKLNEKKRAQIMIVRSEDKSFVVEHIYYLLAQVEKIYLTECERVGKRKGMKLGMSGFGCKHCCAFDRKGLCRFFPARRRTLPAKIKDLSDHLRRCTACPTTVKEKLLQYRENNLDLELVGDSNKDFFDLVWGRLQTREENQC